MILDILTYPDPRLARMCEKVSEITPEIRALADDMLETMYTARGVGLAAPQVGHAIRMLLMDPSRGGAPSAPRILVNPVLELSGENVASEQEGCLSVPLDYRADIVRKSRVLLTATDIDGNSIVEELLDFPAIVLQHEYDHLDGVLFIDRLSRLRRILFDGKMKKWLNRKKRA